YLQPYRDAAARIPQLLARLQELTRDNPAHQKRIAELARGDDDKGAALARTREALDHSGFEAAREELMTEAGREAMLAIRQSIDELITDEQALLATRTAAADETEWRTLMVAIATMLAALGALAIAPLLLRRPHSPRRPPAA